jgi:hypothetical protein
LLDHPAKRESIERQARMTVARRFDWDVIACQQKRMYDELIGS